MLATKLLTLRKATAISRLAATGLSLGFLSLLFEFKAGLFLSRRRLSITESVFMFQYASSMKGTTKETRITVKFLYQIT